MNHEISHAIDSVIFEEVHSGVRTIEDMPSSAINLLCELFYCLGDYNDNWVDGINDVSAIEEAIYNEDATMCKHIIFGSLFNIYYPLIEDRLDSWISIHSSNESEYEHY